jgi:hypothetical protein
MPVTTSTLSVEANRIAAVFFDVRGMDSSLARNLVGYQDVAAKRRSFAPMIVSHSMIATSASKTGWV